ncbi:phospholipase effector Tle1 domain-containing protein [Celerinatantimonas yamalensis]|uniref:DUF2235 domain-containing protein n=1 Tax=Celerinatantimonas yamalensis TaxID=559956 RepID=A0ABW9GDG3_9GAMM
MGAVTTTDGFCLECERKNHWIEIQVIDEYNRPFSNVSGVLTSATHEKFDFQMSHSALLLTHLSAGVVTIDLDNQSWLKEAQLHRPYQKEGKNIDGARGQSVAKPPSEKGYQDSVRQHVHVTAGDLTTLQDGQVLPTRHQKNKADRLKLVTGHSYILKVRGFNYITLRLGVFFDGTANHTYSALWGKQQLQRYYHSWKSLAQTRLEYLANSKNNIPIQTFKRLDASTLGACENECFSYPKGVDGSAANEITNVQKMYNLYTYNDYIDDKKIFVHPEYITGVGTDNIHRIHKADESVWGKGFGRGEWGIIGKANTAIDQITKSIKDLYNASFKYLSNFDGFNRLEFDVFGFSRGAAAARHFINLILAEQQTAAADSFASQFEKACQDNNISLKIGFDWSQNESFEVMFAGLFDTVASYFAPTREPLYGEGGSAVHNDNNGDVQLWLDPSRVKHAVHLRANDCIEYRYNFSSNKLNKADNFYEFTLPGAHSDIGGGYPARSSYINSTMSDYYLLTYEKKCVTQLSHDYSWLDKKKIKQQLSNRLQLYNNNTLWPDHLFYMKFDEGHIGSKHRQFKANLYEVNMVEGELSRVYLAMMYGFAEHFGIPISDLDNIGAVYWNTSRHEDFFIPMKINEFEFRALFEKVLTAARQGKKYQAIDSQSLIQAYLIHHSTDNSITNSPNQIDGVYRRSVYECSKK